MNQVSYKKDKFIKKGKNNQNLFEIKDPFKRITDFNKNANKTQPHLNLFYTCKEFRNTLNQAPTTAIGSFIVNKASSLNSVVKFKKVC